MGYYSMLKIIRSMLYSFKNAMKYICYSILLLLFVCICLLLMTTSSKAFTVTVDNTEYILPDLPTGAGDLPSDVVPPDHFYITKKSNQNIFRLHYPRYRGAYLSDWVYWGITDNGGLAFFNSSFSPVKFLAVEEYSYTVGTNSWSHVGTVETNVPHGAVTSNIVYMSHDYYNASTQQILFAATPLQPSFNSPSFVNYEDENWGNTLVNGEFNYLYIYGNDCDTVLFYMYDNTYLKDGQDQLVFTTVLNRSSPYIFHTEDGNYQWAFDKTLPFNSYLNGHDYSVTLQYQEDGVSKSKTFQWTTNFSQSVIDDNEQSGFGTIESGIDNINNFFNDNTYNSNDIINNMPNADEYESPTESGIDNLFNTFRNAFTTSQAQTVRFIFPNSNGQYIDISSDLVTSKIPQPILFLIQTFYWYVICRYIIKDIASTAEKAKSGEILDDTSDGNIKTDLL